MKSMADIRKILRREGMIGLVKASIRLLLRNIWIRSFRKIMPSTGYQTYNDVRVRERRLGEELLGILRDRPEYESRYCSNIEQYVKRGEKVVVIGGRVGVSSVIAATCVGESGQVILFEASKQGVDRSKYTMQINGTKNIKIKQKIVGPDIDVTGDAEGTPRLDPRDLPECDTLAIDCDGCEVELLRQIKSNPKKIIVEHHGTVPTEDGLSFQYNGEELINILDQKGYTIVEKDVMDRSRAGFPDKAGQFVARKK